MILALIFTKILDCLNIKILACFENYIHQLQMANLAILFSKIFQLRVSKKHLFFINRVKKYANSFES